MSLSWPDEPASRADAQKRRECGRLEQLAPMIVDAVLEAGIAFGVGAGLAFQNDGAAVRNDQPVPDQQHAALAEADAIVVLADRGACPAG